jgi:SAM-dependent methyltransferase
MSNHGWEHWEWDATLFAGAAPHYERGRLPYAPELAGVMAQALALDGSGRLLDVGCGPGTIALRLAHLFEAVVGLDADADMLEVARRAATARGIEHATWVHRRAEALPAGLGTFRVATFAASFHWMDRPRVARAVRSMLEPEGAVVQVDAPAYRPQDPRSTEIRPAHPAVPDDAITTLRERYLGRGRRAGQGIRNTSPSGEDDVFRAAGFQPAEHVVVPDGRELVRTIDDIVANVFSTSATAPHLFGDRVDGFEAELRRLLEGASPSGRFSVFLPDNELRIWHPTTV